MSVVAIKCEVCKGRGWFWQTPSGAGIGFPARQARANCWWCDGSGVESTNHDTDDDKRAQQAIEGERND